MAAPHDEDAPEQAEPEGEVFDHTVPKPENLGVVVLVGLLFLGGGQLVKGQGKRFLGIWAALALLIALLVVGSILTEPESTASAAIRYASIGGVFCLWFYALWDAVTRV